MSNINYVDKFLEKNFLEKIIYFLQKTKKQVITMFFNDEIK